MVLLTVNLPAAVSREHFWSFYFADLFKTICQQFVCLQVSNNVDVNCSMKHPKWKLSVFGKYILSCSGKKKGKYKIKKTEEVCLI